MSYTFYKNQVIEDGLNLDNPYAIDFPVKHVVFWKILFYNEMHVIFFKFNYAKTMHLIYTYTFIDIKYDL